MVSSPISRLVPVFAAAHFGDQLALAALPLAAVLTLKATPAQIGMLVAAQGLAWLVVSMPGGVLVDRSSRTTLIAASQALSAVAFAIAGAAAMIGSAPLLGIAAFVGSSGAVIVTLAAMALVPDLVERASFAAANARLELARAAATLAAPAAAGSLAQALSPALAFGIAALASAVAAGIAFGLPAPAAQAAPAKPPVLVAIREGAAFAIRHALLRGIALCAICWNFAFFALMAIAIPFAFERLGLDARTTGLAQSGYGLGLIAGALLAGRIVARFQPRAILVAGPAISVVAAVVLLIAPHAGGAAAFGLAFFLVGFGPMLWLICQTSIRQLVTPPLLLGRVAATIQVAIYGVRPIGALAGGSVASLFGVDAAMLLVLAAFALSLAVPLASALGRLRAMPAQAACCA